MNTPAASLNVTLQRPFRVRVFACAISVSAVASIAAHAQDPAVIAVMRHAASVPPLDSVTLVGRPGGTVTVKDARGREYLRTKFSSAITFLAGGTPGTQTVTLINDGGKTAGSTTFRVEARTEITDGGNMGELFGLLRGEMFTETPKGYEEIFWNGRSYRYFVN